MKTEIYVWYFPLWKRSNNSVTGDAKVRANTLEDARQMVIDGWAKDWIIGDCRHCHCTTA